MAGRAQLAGGSFEAGPTEGGFRIVLRLHIPQESP
jgi:hypothetical protein